MLTVSDDTAAELLVKEIGLHASGRGSTDAGLAAIRGDLAAAGLPVAQLTQLDGSGLDRGDRASCSLLSATLARSGAAGVLAAGLPVAASTGTLARRFVGTPAAGRVRAKTGSLDHVASLSGFVAPEAGTAQATSLTEPLVFSVIVNGVDDAAALALVDRLTLALTVYPQVPPLAAVGPRR